MTKRSSAATKRTVSLNEWSESDCPRRADIIPWREVDDQGLILDIHSGDYFEINETALLIWKSLDGKHSLGRITSMICQTYAVTQKQAASDLKQLLSILAEAKLILM